MYFVSFTSWSQNAIAKMLDYILASKLFAVEFVAVLQLSQSQTPITGEVSELIKDMSERKGDWYALLFWIALAS